jgi:adenylate kinase family enzyme
MEKRLLGRNEVSFITYSLFLAYVSLANHPLFPTIRTILQGRVDDNIETIRKRFNVFAESSLPVIEYYRAKEKVKEVLLHFHND